MQSFRLGSILGFEIRIDLSWFIIFFLILWSLSATVFPQSYPQLSGWTHIVMGVVGTVLFFASLIAHELSHSLVARTKGIDVSGITLFIFGGISRTRMDAETPGDEFQIAGVGPLTSFILAALFGLLWWVGRSFGWTAAFTGVVGYLAFINLALAIFNLLPGFPLDGGRVFRSIVWKVTGSLKRATQVASWGGRLLGYLLIGFGLFQLFAVPNLLGGLWLILIGWFLSSAADYSYRDYLMRTSLEGVKAREVMSSYPATVPPDLSLQRLVDEYFLHQRDRAFPVTENNRPVGIVDIDQVKEVPRQDWKTRVVGEVMTPTQETVVVRPNESMLRVLEKIQNTEARRVLVARNGELEGMISDRDVAEWLHRRQELRG